MPYGPPQFSIQQHMPQLLQAAQLARPGVKAIGTPAGPSGLAALLAKPGIRDALLATGSALMAQSNQPGSIGSALGQALPMGFQAFQQGKQEAEIDALLETAPPEMRRLLKALPAQARVAALLGLMKPKERQVVAPGAAIVEGDKEVYRNPTAEKPEDPFKGLSSTMRDALFVLGVDPASMTADQRAAARKLAAEMEAEGRGPMVTVNTGSGDISKLPVGVQSGIVGAQGVRSALDRFEGFAKQWLEIPAAKRAVSQIGVPNKEMDTLLGNMESTRQELVLNLKNLAELGVLAGPDMEIMDKMIGDPTSKESLVRDPEYMLTRIERVRDYVNGKIKAYEATYPGVVVPGATAPPKAAGPRTKQGATLLKALGQ
jgi:hypothetical protein